MRVSDAQRWSGAIAQIQDGVSRLDRAQRQTGSGKRIDTPSDDPLGSAEATRIRSQQAANDTHLRSLADAKAWLATQDNALQSASTLMSRAQALVIQAQNGSQDATSRDAIASELDGIRDQLALSANATYQGTAVFGAFGNRAVNLSGTTATFVGTPGAEVKRRISDGDVINVNTDGATVFGFAAGDDVFGVISRLSASIRSGNTAAVNTDASVLDARANDIRSALGDVGTRGATVESVTNRHEDNKVVLSDRLGSVEDVDVNTAAMEFAQANRTYEAVLATVGQTQRVSLIDFLH